MSIIDIISDCGITTHRYETVAGGDISTAYCLHATEGRYFLKVNAAALYPGMFEKEARGLGALREASSLTVPRVIKYGTSGTWQFLLLEWVDRGSPGKDFWENFGAALARMHQPAQPYFGWPEDNYIGSLPQQNGIQESWHQFYAHCRIIPLVQKLYNTGEFGMDDVKSAELVCGKLEQRFPQEAPSLLHGDLWSGNFTISPAGEAVLFDPAVYYGHREMDLGMTRLFGGFDPRFYQAYQETYPPENGWQQRIPLAQLYPVLVHAVLFGRHYTARAREIIHAFR